MLLNLPLFYFLEPPSLSVVTLGTPADGYDIAFTYTRRLGNLF
jgi:hypothetical protein